MKLSNDQFSLVIKHTPLISIDLIVSDPAGKILLGWRTNAPASSTWFVPGGRIVKDETISQAFSRISKVELGLPLKLEQGEFIGIYEHFYPGDNYFNDKDFGTHYIVLGFTVKIKEQLKQLPGEQHREYKWAAIDEILSDDQVHQNVKNYFNGTPGLK